MLIHHDVAYRLCERLWPILGPMINWEPIALLWAILCGY